MSKADRRIDVSDLPEDATAELPAGEPEETTDDVKGGIRIGLRAGQRLSGKRYSSVRKVRGLREDGRFKGWML